MHLSKTIDKKGPLADSGRGTRYIPKATAFEASMDDTQKHRHYDLEDRTLRFAKDIIALVNLVTKTVPNLEISKQLVRSAGSVGANYIEANESLGKKDFLMRIRISRKESKESRYWLKLLMCGSELDGCREKLVQESTELMKIFGAILRNATNHG